MTRNGFLQLLEQRTLIGDGAMGTMLYQHGVFFNTCFDELNLTAADLIRKVHQQYVDVGVDFIETNTFGANRLKLAPHGLADKVVAINTAAVEIARRCLADTDVLLAGAVGPLGPQMAPYGRLSREEAHDVYAEQVRALAEAGVDMLLLETFANPDELIVAARAAAEVSELPIIAQLTCNQNNETPYSQSIDQAVAQVAQEPAVSVVGLNCSVGPMQMLHSLECVRPVTDKPISLQPNAGLPREVDGRMFYMTTPEYMAEYAKKFFEKGARIIGGCCGTTPEHIGEIARAVRALDKAGSQVVAEKPAATAVSVAERSEAAPCAVPLAEKSRLGAKLAAGEPITTIEVTPPRGCDLSTIIEKAQLCAEYGIDAINIPDGPRASSRISPMITAIEIQQSADIEAVLHVCCRDRNIIGMQSDMLGAHAIGLRNMLLITGDPPKLGEYPDATAVYDLDAIGLTAVVRNLNAGHDVGGKTFAPPIALTLGVGANPVAADLPREIERFKQKVDAGAEYAVTQPVFDPETLFDFLDATTSHPIPIVAGIWPFTSYKNAEFMANEVPGVVVPDVLLERMKQAQTREEGRAIGIEIAREMMAAIADRVAGYAVSAPFGNVRIALAALGKLSIEEI